MTTPATPPTPDKAPPVQIPKAKVAPPPVQVHVAPPVAPPPVIPRARAVLAPVSDTPQRAARSPWQRWCDAQLYRLTGENLFQASFSISTLVHSVLVVVLGLLWIEPEVGRDAALVIVAHTGADAGAQAALASLQSAVSADGAELQSAVEIRTEVSIVAPQTRATPPRNDTIVPWDLGMNRTTARHLLDQAENNPYSGLDGRNPLHRESLLGLPGGPTRRSEEAVERGLRWLAAHQRPDGSWHYDLARGPCQGQCRHSGTVGSTTAATSMALLCFLGAGYTHLDGEHREVVRRGLYYLEKKVVFSPQGADYRDGTQYGMYSQGLTAIALCEAYIMTHDRALQKYAQPAIDYILYAQDSKGGGWRYTPGEPGDTTVTAWQVMALKSARAAYLRVPTNVMLKVSQFLDSVQSDGGAHYGYLAAGKEPTTTAVGLLCRMLLGWPHDQPALVKGVTFLATRGPSRNNMYYNYYATQVLHHFGGPWWFAWNEQLREYLVRSQASDGHENGSWQFDDDHESGKKGGRLYNTCMAIMTLEVYYRYLPIYGNDTQPPRRGGL